MTEERKPWAFVALRNGKMRGVISPELPAKDIKKFYRDFAGADIRTVYDRPEYEALLQNAKL